ncbi:MAG: EF-hand domain-containing protein [Sphingomonadaceae bacterium]
MNKLHFAALVIASSLPAIGMANTPPVTSPADATAASTPSTTSAPHARIEQIVSTDFPTYDADKSGELNKSEFTAWMVAAKSQSGAAVPDKQWLTDAFTKADTDNNKSVSAAELTSFLSA